MSLTFFNLRRRQAAAKLQEEAQAAAKLQEEAQAKKMTEEATPKAPAKKVRGAKKDVAKK